MIKHKKIAPDPHVEEQVIFAQQSLGIAAAYGQRGVNDKKRKQNRNSKSQEQRVYEMARKSMQVLYQTRTVFPFDFFPDTLTITANKIEVVNSSFFGSNQTTSVPLRDIANVEIQTSPFFATVRIINIRFPMHPLTLQYLKKPDAIKAKNIIDGLLVAISQGADITAIEPEQFLREIEQVGQGAINE